jgi:protein-ribulosamine 3-kinase
VNPAIESAVREALGDPALIVRRMVPTGGGCISHATRVETSAGNVFVKWNDDGPPDLFLREADGLRAMAEAQCGLAIPRVFAAWGPMAERPAMIVMEYLTPGRAPGDDEALGRGLAALHRRRAPQYGFPAASYCGATRQDNPWTAGWVEFCRDHRLRSLVVRIEAERGLSPGDRHIYERLLERLPDLLPHDTVPSLIHGDLWSGNVLHTSRGPALVDPACSYSDREMEFGITTLFGGFSQTFWHAYDEAWPLPPGWRERNPIYQLYHLLNHYYLFGGHYGAEALSIAQRYR